MTANVGPAKVSSGVPSRTTRTSTNVILLLPGPCVAGLNPAGRSHDVVAGGDEVGGAEVGDGVTAQGALVAQVELVEGLAGGEAGGADAELTAVGGAGGHFAFQAGGEELFMG